ncbi:extracellular solute-binding protein [Natronosporangium hydrolyticum]|uniref:Extracellular solute-binding protein n=1 Tax=Natronosporangium hydrolyticum TaxID=2811111 RepID=A0A895YD51_9ACTN|nr:extracellular solute-binding protein [Natronosporangium hydrolyticum]QSB13383.1 extracellular solute-binding protein [Natronosporangium hydrolyticum]
MRRISRRRLLGGAVLLGAGATGLTSLTACGNGGGSGSGSGSNLRFAWWGNPDRDRRTQAAVDQFVARADRGVDTEPSNWDDYWSRLATQISGGNPPDLMQMDYQYIAEYAGRGALLELDDYVPDPLDLSAVPEEAVENGRIGGTLYGITMGYNTFAMMKNLQVIRDAGVDEPDHTLTWSEFAELCREIGNNTPSGVFGTQNAMGSKETLECWLHQRGKALFTADGQLGYDPADLEEWFEFWQELAETGGAVDMETTSEALPDLSDWEVPSGRGAFNFHWSNIYPAFVDVSADEIGIGMYPQGDGAGAQPGQYYKASMLLSIPSAADDPDAAAELLQALVLDAEIAAELGFERGVPSSEEVREVLRPDASDEELASLEYVEFVEDKVGEVPPPPPEAAGRLDDQLIFFAEEAGFGRMSIPDAVDAYFQEATNILG